MPKSTKSQTVFFAFTKKLNLFGLQKPLNLAFGHSIYDFNTYLNNNHITPAKDGQNKPANYSQAH